MTAPTTHIARTPPRLNLPRLQLLTPAPRLAPPRAAVPAAPAAQPVAPTPSLPAPALATPALPARIRPLYRRNGALGLTIGLTLLLIACSAIVALSSTLYGWPPG